MKRILLTVILSLGVLLSCAHIDNNHPTITKDQAYERALISEMMGVMNEELNPYTTIIDESNYQEMVNKIGAIIERFGYDKEDFRVEGWREGYLYYMSIVINLKYYEEDYTAQAMYVWADAIRYKKGKP